MYQLNVTGVLYTIDAEKYHAALKRAIEREMKLAARAFATATLARIPVRTGFVSGAFTTLTDLVGGGARLNPIISFTRRVLRAARGFLTQQKSKGEYYYPPGGGKVLKSAVAGRQYATKAEDIFKWDGATLTFKYAVDISYFRVNDSTSRIPSAPWGAFAAGIQAFEAHMVKAATTFDVKIEDYLVPHRIG